MTKTYNNILDLFIKMKINCSKDILPCDNNGYFAWCDQETEIVYQIKTNDFSKTIKSLSENDIKILNKYFPNRSLIWDVLNNLPCLNKVEKLKAFL